MSCCFGCCDVVFPSNSPKRFLEGSLLMLVGSLLWLIFEQIDRRDEQSRNVQGLAQITNRTGLVVACFVCFASIVAFILHVLSIRVIRRQDANVQLARENKQRQQFQQREGLTLWEWFFYPELETVPAERQLKIIRQFQTTYHHLIWSNHGRLFLLAPAVALFVLLMVRLFWGVDDFDGQFFFLDFGWKYGLLPRDTDTNNAVNDSAVYNEPAEKNTAFFRSWNNYGHALQGFGSALLAFPVVYNVFLRFSHARWWHALVHLAPYALTVYPAYNLIRRMSKASSAFAGSSFANNSLEWATGFIVALALGNLVTSFTLYRRLRAMVSSTWSSTSGEDTDEENQHDHDEESYPLWWRVWHEEGNDRPGICVRMLQSFLGMLLWGTVVTAALMIAVTWHGCLDGSPDICINANESASSSSSSTRIEASKFAILMAIPFVVLVGTLVMRCRSDRRR